MTDAEPSEETKEKIQSMVDRNSAADLAFGKGQVRNIAHREVDRISGEACKRLALKHENEVQKEVRAAKVIAQRAGRETVKEEDVTAVQEILEMTE